MPKATLGNLDSGQLDMMWSMLKIGGLKASTDVPSSGIPSVSPLDFLTAEWERKHPQQIQFQE